MRIALVNGNYKPAWGNGGPARLIFELATYFRSRDWQVSVVTSNFSGEPQPLPFGYADEDGVDVFRVRAYHDSGETPSGWWYSELARELRRELGRSQGAVIFNTRAPFSTLAPVLCRQMGLPYAIAALGSLPGGRSPFNRAVRLGLDPLVVFPNCRKAKYCIAQTVNEVEEYRKVGVDPRKIQLIPLGSDTRRFANLPARGEFRRRLGISETAPVALFVGRLHYLKGIDTSIAAASIIRRTLPDFQLVLVGKDHGDEARLRQFAADSGLADCVKFVGPLYENDVLGAYTDADAYVVAPRHFEETSLASIEASFCGTPLVFTREAEAPFFAEEGGGYCVENSPEKVAEGLLRILSNRENIQRMAEAARAVAMRHFTMEAVGRCYENGFEFQEAR